MRISAIILNGKTYAVGFFGTSNDLDETRKKLELKN
jgi:hypothetical protein